LVERGGEAYGFDGKVSAPGKALRKREERCWENLPSISF